MIVKNIFKYIIKIYIYFDNGRILSDTNEFHEKDRTLETKTTESIGVRSKVDVHFFVTRSRIVCLIAIFVCERLQTSVRSFLSQLVLDKSEPQLADCDSTVILH